MLLDRCIELVIPTRFYFWLPSAVRLISVVLRPSKELDAERATQLRSTIHSGCSVPSERADTSSPEALNELPRRRHSAKREPP